MIYIAFVNSKMKYRVTCRLISFEMLIKPRFGVTVKAKRLKVKSFRKNLKQVPFIHSKFNNQIIACE